jgi:hypothetical protein
MKKSYTQEADFGATEPVVKLPSDFVLPTATTGTVDDDDDPAGEREDENEAPVRETDENMETTGEFRKDDEDRDDDE